MQVDGRKTYKIRFHPKRLTSPVLDGEVNIDSASYALQSASARMPKGVNVNWIKHLRLENENRIVRDSTWFRSRDRVSAEFSVTTADSSKLTSFIGTREVVYTDVRIGEPIPAEVIRMDNNVVIGDQGQESSKDEAFWESVRPYRLSDKEKRHLFDGRLGAERPAVPQYLHPDQHGHRRLLEHQVHRHRPLL